MKENTLKIVMLLAMLCYITATQAQYKVLEKKDLSGWPCVYTEKSFISPDGRAVVYEHRILNTLGSIKSRYLVLRNLETNKEVLISGSAEAAFGFAGNGSFFLARTSTDSLAVINVNSDKKFIRPGVAKLKILNANTGKIIYQSKSGELFWEDLIANRKIAYGKVEDFDIAKNGSKAVLASAEMLALLDVETGDFKKIAAGGSYSNFRWTDSHDRVYFLDRRDGLSTIKCYVMGSGKVKPLVNDKRMYGSAGLRINGITKINGIISIEIEVIKIDTPHSFNNDLKAKVNIWSYTDAVIQPLKQIAPEPIVSSYKSLFLISSGEVKQLGDDTTQVLGPFNGWYLRCGKMGQFSMISEKGGGYRTLDLPRDVVPFDSFFISGNGKNVVYYHDNSYHVYDVQKRVSSPLVVGVNNLVWHEDHNTERISGKYSPRDNRLVVMGDHSFGIADEYDIWMVDVSNGISSVCITNGYGKRKGIEFGIAKDENNLPMYMNGRLVLKAFGPSTKKNGFFTSNITKNENPVELLYSDNVYSKLQKSGDGKVWLFSREGTDRSANFFVTKDFKSLQQISFVGPENKYNWPSSELISADLVNGKKVQAVVYRPRDFDPKKKYPVIFQYYETRTKSKNEFARPGLSNGDLNVPWFVSRGYLVVEPDFYYRQGFTGQSALECLNAITDELVRLPYVDSARIGLKGHSFGGFETLYFVTHSNRFAAATATAPISNLISMANTYSDVWGEFGRMVIENPAIGIVRMATTMWERPDWHITNSPVFEGDKVRTPLLMMHNQKDVNVPFGQGMEFFLSMRRLGRPCWLLEYENGTHVVTGENEQEDFTIRTEQFYDHYLKGAPAPLWMIEGMKFKDRKYMPGYGLDSLGRKPGPGINSEEEQQKIEDYSKIPFAEKLKRINNNK